MGAKAAGVRNPPVKIPPTIISIFGLASATRRAAFSAAVFQSNDSTPRPHVA